MTITKIRTKTERHGKGLNIKGQYRLFIREQPLNSTYDISLEEFSLINSTFNTKVADMLLKGEAFHMPYKLGYLQIQKKKMTFEQKTLNINWKATKEHNKPIYHLNDHTNNFKHSFKWIKVTKLASISKFYKFIPARRMRINLAKLLLANGTADFVEFKPRVFTN